MDRDGDPESHVGLGQRPLDVRRELAVRRAGQAQHRADFEEPQENPDEREEPHLARPAAILEVLVHCLVEEIGGLDGILLAEGTLVVVAGLPRRLRVPRPQHRRGPRGVFFADLDPDPVRPPQREAEHRPRLLSGHERRDSLVLELNPREVRVDGAVEAADVDDSRSHAPMIARAGCARHPPPP
jgi:hypothetical protein